MQNVKLRNPPAADGIAIDNFVEKEVVRNVCYKSVSLSNIQKQVFICLMRR